MKGFSVLLLPALALTVLPVACFGFLVQPLNLARGLHLRTARGGGRSFYRQGLVCTVAAAGGGDDKESGSKEERKVKYETLFKELIWKASKLPPGSSKTAYLVKAKNAKAMADALSYDKGEAEKEGEASDAAAEEVTGFPRGEPISAGELDIMHATPALTKQLTACVNYAYRGKQGKEGWTGEMRFIEGVRISEEDMENLLLEGMDGDSPHVFAAALNDEIVGSVKVESLGNKEAEIGMFSVDPDYQSRRVGSLLMDKAEGYCKKVLGAKTAVMHVLDNREDLLVWYEKRGFVRTGVKIPFPTGANVGVPKMELQFERLERSLW